MKLKSGSSYLMCARMMPMTDSYHENAMITQEKNECFMKGCNDEQQNGMENKDVTNLKNMTFTKAHEILGHAGPQLTISTARALGFKVKSNNVKCEHCGKAKSMQKNLKRIASNPSTEKGVRLMIDITSSKEVSLGGNKYWLAIWTKEHPCYGVNS